MSAPLFARADVEDALRELGEILARARKVADIAICRGAAILLQFELTFRTSDVDAQVESGDHGALMQAAKLVAERHGWRQSWLSEAVTMYLGESGGTTLHATYPSESRPGLRVYVAKPDYLLAMKLRAMRTASRDASDAALLARACNLPSAMRARMPISAQSANIWPAAGAWPFRPGAWPHGGSCRTRGSSAAWASGCRNFISWKARWRFAAA